MEDLNDKVLGGNLSAPEWNQVPSETQNVIEQTGQTLTNADLDQLGKAIANYVGNSNFYTDNNVANVYALTTIPFKQTISEYTDGLGIEFIPSQSNTGPSQVSVGGLGLVQIRDPNDVALVGGEIVAGKRLLLKHDINTGRFVIDSVIDIVPVGVIKAWPTDTPPIGYLECDGATISRTLFDGLFAVLDVIYGDGDASTTFEIPNLRGEFIRGFDNNEGNDPDSGNRTDRGDGQGGDFVGTKQTNEVQAHIHGIETVDGLTVGGTNFPQRRGAAGNNQIDDNTEPGPTANPGGNETRPRNVYMMYIIKF